MWDTKAFRKPENSFLITPKKPQVEEVLKQNLIQNFSTSWRCSSFTLLLLFKSQSGCWKKCPTENTLLCDSLLPLVCNVLHFMEHFNLNKHLHMLRVTLYIWITKLGKYLFCFMWLFLVHRHFSSGSLLSIFKILFFFFIHALATLKLNPKLLPLHFFFI